MRAGHAHPGCVTAPSQHVFTLTHRLVHVEVRDCECSKSHEKSPGREHPRTPRRTDGAICAAEARLTHICSRHSPRQSSESSRIIFAMSGSSSTSSSLDVMWPTQTKHWEPWSGPCLPRPRACRTTCISWETRAQVSVLLWTQPTTRLALWQLGGTLAAMSPPRWELTFTTTILGMKIASLLAPGWCYLAFATLSTTSRCPGTYMRRKGPPPRCRLGLLLARSSL